MEAKAFQRLARELSRLSEKQLARLEPLVGEGVVDAVGVAASLSIRNQGRQRQESLVARLLRESVEEVEALQVGWGGPGLGQQAWMRGEAAVSSDAGPSAAGRLDLQAAPAPRRPPCSQFHRLAGRH